MGWGIENVLWVSDRGILTNSKIKELVKPIEGVGFATVESFGTAQLACSLGV